jgi:cell division protein FtsW (lipid II flippase)
MALPALLLGAFIMQRHGLPTRIWGQQVLVGITLLSLATGWNLVRKGKGSRGPGIAAALVALTFLGMTFLDGGLHGVHRWVRLGPVLLHPGAIFAPVLVLALGAPSWAAKGGERVPRILACIVALALALQPDAAQAAAFSGAMITLWLGRRPFKASTLAATGFLVAATLWAWLRPDGLQPVPHVEGIVGLAAQDGILWQAMAVGTLMLLPLPILFPPSDARYSRGAALAVYTALCTLAPLAGAFPVPILGFGFSPMLGYFLGLGWLISSVEPRTRNLCRK